MLVSGFMVLIILMQRPRSEGLGAAFGAGMTDSVFGAQTSNVLQKITVWCAALFFILTLSLTTISARKSSQSPIAKALQAEAAAAPKAPETAAPASAQATATAEAQTQQASSEKPLQAAPATPAPAATPATPSKETAKKPAEQPKK